ncbi:hypothetical protein [Methylotenera sp.]|uniref:hypothetical protein n=1 Tax=Methylotenera sp. TaxID=2051956 RepID=UPI0024893694|nr:hypothetical protein [Methylotenera sp.]MDI1298871.1 hypothetical protein [Methylotenera sp.]
MKVNDVYEMLPMNRSRFTLVLLFILALATSIAQSQEQKEKPILRGKIGNTSVMFCFAQPESGRTAGDVVGYYYPLTTGASKYLHLSEKGQYFEDYQNDKTVIWQLNEITDSKITGYKLVGNKKERIDLSRLKTKPKKPTNKNGYDLENQGCDDAFNQPRVTSLLKKIKIQEKLVMDKTYQVMIFEDLNTAISYQLALLPDTFENAAQYQQEQKKKIETTLYFRQDLKDGQNPSDETIKESIVYWDENWLTIRQEGDEYSGGAHPNFWQNFTTYNIQTGKEEELWGWFKNVKVKTSNIDSKIWKDYQPSERFRKLACKFDNFTICKKVFESDDGHDDIAYSSCVEAKNNPLTKNDQSENDACDSIDEPNRLSLGLSSKGLVVRTHLDYGSGSGSYNSLIPYAALAPYLNQKGHENIEQIMLHKSAVQ